ncbi:MAG: TolB family protein [Candidatus Krumholzibacteriia bacterium]
MRRARRPAPRVRTVVAGLLACLCPLLATGCDEIKIDRRHRPRPDEATPATASPERHLEGLRSLTDRGVNRQASFNSDGTRIVWLCRPEPAADFGIRVMNADGSAPMAVDTGPGRRHDPVFTPNATSILYAAAGPGAAAPAADPGAAPAAAPGAAPGADGPAGLWLFDASLDLWLTGPDDLGPRILLSSPGYDAEASYSWGGTRIVHATQRAGRGALVMMEADGRDAHELLAMDGCVGGPQISPDGSLLVFHATPPGQTTTLEIYTSDLAGGNLRRLTTFEATSFTPVWHPSQQLILFASNAEGHDMELYLIRPDGTGLERVTFSPGFDGFPAFSRDGRLLLWTSERGSAQTGETQIYRANWRG